MKYLIIDGLSCYNRINLIPRNKIFNNNIVIILINLRNNKNYSSRFI